MEIVVKDKLLLEDVINGIIGNNNEDIIKIFDNASIIPLISTYYQDSVYHELLYSMRNKHFKDKKQKILSIIRIFNLDKEFLKKDIKELSLMEQRLLDYLILFLNCKKVIVINEPFKYLNSYYQKKVINYLNNLKRKYHKYIILLSKNSDFIYQYCDYYLVYNDNNSIYTNNIKDIDFKEFNIDKPQLVEFSDLVNKKGININYYKDVRDLMKDVYRNA